MHPTDDSIAQTEADARIQLAAAYRAADYFGWSELTANHITLRMPGEPVRFLINPFGLLYSEVTASSLISIDVDGAKQSESAFDVNPAGFAIHRAVHLARDNAHCVIHVHTAIGMAISALDSGFEPYSLEGCDFFERIAYHSFEGPVFDKSEGERLAEGLGDARAVVLRNHGLITVGETVAEAFLLMYRLMLAAQVQLLVQQTGRPATLPSDLLARLSLQRQDDYFRIGKGSRRAGFGDLDFAAVMRLMDKVDPGYRL